jgi:hypothetical protein
MQFSAPAQRFVRLGVLGVCLLGCGGGGGSAPQPVSATASASQRLQGNWRLLSFEPSLALEEPLKGLLDAQLKTLTIGFSNGEFTAAGPSVNTSGRYEVKSAQGDSLSARIYDRAGAGYNVSGSFVGAQFQFLSEDSPWAGRGVLERVQ